MGHEPGRISWINFQVHFGEKICIYVFPCIAKSFSYRVKNTEQRLYFGNLTFWF